ncbi:hypothetical protein [Streptomyces cupreus]|nr:hypothetical protein [Streptomyces cupreus]
MEEVLAYAAAGLVGLSSAADLLGSALADRRPRLNIAQTHGV